MTHRDHARLDRACAQTIALAFALIVSTCAHALNLGAIARSYDGVGYQEYPLGDKPQVVCNTPSGWTFAKKGTGDGSICDVSGDWVVTAIGQDDEGDFPYVYKACGSDCQVIARIPETWEGHSENFTSFGVGISESTDSSAWYIQAYATPDGRLRCKAGIPGPDDYNSTSVSAGQLPDYLGVVHLDATNEVLCLRSDDGSTYAVFGTFSRDLSEPNIGYVFGSSHSVGASTTATITNASLSHTVTINPGVNHAPTISGVPDQNAVENSSFSLDLTQYAADSDGNAMSYSATGLSGSGMSVSSAGLLSGTPNAAALSGSPLSVVVTVTDPDLATGSDTFTITVEDDNPPEPGTRDVKFTATFATATVKGPSSGSVTDAFLIETLPINQTGNSNFSNAGSAGTCCGSSSGLDSRVVASDTVSGETITPRAGPFFYRVELLGRRVNPAVAGKDYSCLSSASCASTANKPRSKLIFDHGSLRFDSMEEFWVGFSMYVPQNFEHERAKGQHGNGPTIFNINNSTSEGILELKTIIKGSKSYPTANSGSDLCGNNSACLQSNNTKFWASWPTRTTLGEPGYDSKDWAELNDINSCKGKWIDVVVRGVNDPFSSTTNGSSVGGAAISYTGNRGLLEIWTSDCSDAPDASGYREMVKRVSVCKAPFGLVQRTGSNQRWGAGLTNYAYGWKPTDPTSRTHSYYVAYDEIRYGITGDEGTGYADVNPSGKTWETGEAPCSYP